MLGCVPAVDDLVVVGIGIWPDRCVEYQNVILGFGIRAQVDADDDAIGIIVCGSRSALSEIVEGLAGVDAILSRLFGTVHNLGQNIWSACDVLL